MLTFLNFFTTCCNFYNIFHTKITPTKSKTASAKIPKIRH